DDDGLNQVEEVHGLHVNGFSVAAGRKGQFRLLCQHFGAVHGHAEEVAKGGHCAHFAVGEAILEFLLIGKIHEIGIEYMGQSVPAHAPGGGHHQHGHFAIQFDDDSFDHSVTGYLHM